jgi:hypothetical protein
METPQATPPATPSAAASEAKAKPASRKDTPVKPRQGLLFQLGLVIGVALVVATLFTAWTPEVLDVFPPSHGSGGGAAQPAFPPGLPTPLGNLIGGSGCGHWKNDPARYRMAEGWMSTWNRYAGGRCWSVKATGRATARVRPS